MYEIGRITTTHGIKGEVRVLNISDFDRFVEGEKLFINYNGKKIFLEVESARPHKGMLIVKFKEYNNINDVIPFKGLTIYSETRGQLDDNEFYYKELVGLKVLTTKKIFVGIVTQVIEVPQGHLLEVENEEKKTLIPFVRAFIVDVFEDEIIIDPIEGLI